MPGLCGATQAGGRHEGQIDAVPELATQLIAHDTEHDVVRPAATASPG